MPFEPRAVVDVERDFQQIARDIRSSYMVGYVPTETDGRPGLHRIHVEVTLPDGRRLLTHTRLGYLAGPAREDRNAK